MVIGRIHSFESMGLVDGPGIRNVIFLQGCNLRCSFCHNPDTWNFNAGEEISSEELIKKILRFKPYFKKSGGVTFSGGEPLLQPEFLLQMLKLCKENNIHTAIDTAGYGKGDYDEILKYTDLVLLDIKHIDSEKYKYLTCQCKCHFDKFLHSIKKNKSKLWIRQVIIPNFNDSKEYITSLANVINEIKSTNVIEKVELLSYHILGKSKYENLNYPYRLLDVPPMDKEKCKKLENLLLSLIN